MKLGRLLGSQRLPNLRSFPRNFAPRFPLDQVALSLAASSFVLTSLSFTGLAGAVQVSSTAAGLPACSAVIWPAVQPIQGGLTSQSQFNSNFPETISRYSPQESIALSTLSPEGKAVPEAHLNHSFEGDFRLFSSHQNQVGRPLHQVIVVHNPSTTPVQIQVRSYASRHTGQAPYHDSGSDFSGVVAQPIGPGDAVAALSLGQAREAPAQIQLGAQETKILKAETFPMKTERITHAELHSSGPVQLALLYTPQPPTDASVERQLHSSGLLPLDPQVDLAPTPLDRPGAVLYGRVSGVAASSSFQAGLNSPESPLEFEPGQAHQFMVNATRNQTALPGRDEASPLLVRRPGSALSSHGNYGARVDIKGQLHNPSQVPVRVQVFMDASGVFRQTLQVQQDLQPPRTVSLRSSGAPNTSPPFWSLTLQPGQTSQVSIRYYNAANNTPPQVLQLAACQPEG